jgi:hypothetical protein
MNRTHGYSADDVVCIASKNTDTGKGFVSLDGTWINEHDSISRWVYEKHVLLNKRWPRYAILVSDRCPKFKLIEPREKYGEMAIKTFRTLSTDPWIRSCAGDRIRPISDGFMCLLIDMHLVEKSYPIIFENILNKLYHGCIPAPNLGPLGLLKEIGSDCVVQYVSQLLLEEKIQDTADNSSVFRPWDWDILRITANEHYGSWYDIYKSREIYDMFSRVPKEGEFFDALERTIATSSFYANVIWSIVVTVRKQGLRHTDARNAIIDWSVRGSTVWYTDV